MIFLNSQWNLYTDQNFYLWWLKHHKNYSNYFIMISFFQPRKFSSKNTHLPIYIIISHENLHACYAWLSHHNVQPILTLDLYFIGDPLVSTRYHLGVLLVHWFCNPSFIGLTYQGEVIVFRFIIKYKSLKDFDT